MAVELPGPQNVDTPEAEAPAPSGGRRTLVLPLIVIGALIALAAALLLPVAVRLQGVGRTVPVGAVVGDLASSQIPAPPGDLLSVTGQVLRAGGGAPPQVSVNGVVATTQTPIPAGAVITATPGTDTVEPTRTVVVKSDPKVVVVGSGPVSSVEDSGTARKVRVTLGVLSGAEVTRTVISGGEPMVIRRERAWKGAKRVALTFDDGPWPGTTGEVLALLNKAQVKATFFMVGRTVTRNPTIARAVLDSGMEIGNHSYSHLYLAHEPADEVRPQIIKADRAIKAVLGIKPVWYRPAGGSTTPNVYRQAAKLGHRVVLWTVDPRDWSRPGSRKIARRVLDHVRPGAVILLHDGGGNRSQTVRALKKILHGLKARGYDAVTLSELFAKRKP